MGECCIWCVAAPDFSSLQDRHFGVRIKKELEYMGSFPSPPDVKLHQVPDMTAMNAQPTADFVKECQPDVVLLFGPGRLIIYISCKTV